MSWLSFSLVIFAYICVVFILLCPSMELTVSMGTPLERNTVVNEVTALSEVITLQLPLVRCEQSLRQDVRFLQYLVSELSEKLKNSNRNASISLSYPVENRLASYLMAVCERDVFQEDHGEVSSMIGCSYRQLQRCLSQFCEQGLLCKCEKGVYRINNRKQLQTLGQDIYGGITS